MTEIEMLNRMFYMQMKLDENIYRKHKTEYDEERTRLALMDELGELIHELKGDWCWWKFTQPPVDREKVLEELVDCWHFAMSNDYHIEDFEYILKELDYYAKCKASRGKLSYKIADVMTSLRVTVPLMLLTKQLGFTVEQVYEMYLKKNEINFKRLEENY